MSLPLWGSLYDAVALGMYGYARSAYRVRVVAPPDERIVKGTLYVAAHRAETDVPIICGSYYFAAQVWKQRNPRLHFAARDDLFQQGFFAGFPPTLPRPLRRVLHPVGIGRYLPHVRVHPISSAVTMKLVQALEFVDRELALEHALPAELNEQMRERASQLGTLTPSYVADVLHGDYADLLWTNVEAGDLPEDVFAQAWARRAAVATGDLRHIVELVGEGEALLLFPEGRPSPDGGLGPLRRGLGAVIRRGKPQRIRAFGLAYDRLTTGRDTVILSVLKSVAPPTGRGEPDLLDHLASAIALTCGQVVATSLLRAAESDDSVLRPAALDEAIVEALSHATESGRVVDPLLDEKHVRRRLLEDAIKAAERRGVVSVESSRSLRLNVPAIRSDAVIARLATEHAAVKREMTRGPSG